MKTTNLSKFIIPGTRSERLDRLEECKKVLKEEFIGLSSIIDQVILSITPWYITPEIIQRPVIVSLWGMTGTGKSSIVRHIIEILGLTGKSLFFDCGQEGNDNISTTISDKITDYLGSDDFESGKNTALTKDLVYVFDEFQYARTIDDHGCELSRSSLRPIWSLLDDGIVNLIEYRYDITYFGNYLDDLISYHTDNSSFKIDNLKVTDPGDIEKIGKSSLGFFYFNKNTRPYECSDTINDDGSLVIIQDRVLKTLYRSLDHLQHGLGKETVEKLYQATDSLEILEILKEARPIVTSPKRLDCSSSLIFILGNLDEAFGVEKELNPDSDADVFYDITSKVTVFDIKEALTSRFRAEQIARFGNNLIKYPTLKKCHFVEIIKRESDRLLTDFKVNFGISINLDESILDLLYSEGVYPTQGVRPLFTTIGTILTPLFSDIIINQSYIKDNVMIKLSDGYNLKSSKVQVEIIISPDFTVTRDIVLDLGKLRDPGNIKTRYINSVHEIGHAVAMTYLTGELPSNIVSVSSGGGGFCVTYISDKAREIKSKEDLDNEIIVALSGYVAESLVFGDDSPGKCLLGSGSDIKSAWELFSRACYNEGYYTPDLFSNYSVLSNDTGVTRGFSDSNLLVRMQNSFHNFKEISKRILTENLELIKKASLRLGETGSMGSSEFMNYIERYGKTLTPEYIKKKQSENSIDWYLVKLKE